MMLLAIILHSFSSSTAAAYCLGMKNANNLIISLISQMHMIGFDVFWLCTLRKDQVSLSLSISDWVSE